MAEAKRSIPLQLLTSWQGRVSLLTSMQFDMNFNFILVAKQALINTTCQTINLIITLPTIYDTITLQQLISEQADDLARIMPFSRVTLSSITFDSCMSKRFGSSISKITSQPRGCLFWLSSDDTSKQEIYGWLILQLKTNFHHKRIIIHMEKHSLKQYVYPLERLHLEPLSLNIPLPNQPLHNHTSQGFISHRQPPLKSERHNKTTTLKTLAGLKQALSRSLFSKKPRKADLTKQKLKDDLTYFKSDSKPISPESQQKQPLKAEKQLLVGEGPCFEEADNQVCFSNTDEILDTKFNKILELNLAQERQFDLDIESKFTSKKSQNSFKANSEVEPLEPCVTFAHLVEHERLLQEENGFIREQLMIFTEVIDGQRLKNSELKHKSKSLQRQNSKLRQRNRIIQQQLLDKEQKCYNLSIQNQQYKIQIHSLTQGKQSLMEQLEELTKEFNDICSKLESYQNIKEKEIQGIIEERNREKEQYEEYIHQKDREINELNQYIDQLQHRITALEEKTPKFAEKVTSSADGQQQQGNYVEEDDPFEQKESRLRNSSICLSLAEAQSLKNIIETKEQMFQRQIQNLKRQSLKEDLCKSKIIEDLTFRIKRYEEEKELATKGDRNQESEIEQLKNTYIKRINTLQHYLQEERQQNQRLNQQLAILQQKYEKAQKEQDQEIEDLLEKCVDELQKERHTNYLLREEINSLKRTFAKELYYVQQIEDNVYLN